MAAAAASEMYVKLALELAHCKNPAHSQLQMLNHLAAFPNGDALHIEYNRIMLKVCMDTIFVFFAGYQINLKSSFYKGDIPMPNVETRPVRIFGEPSASDPSPLPADHTNGRRAALL
jgi:hypothetical protein